MILVGDIGGTKTNLALHSFEKNTYPLKKSRQFVSKSYNSLEEIIELFLEDEAVEISSACFGIAGPVINNRCQTTNLAWSVDAAFIKKRFGIKSVKLLNDLEATAYGMLYLEDNEFVYLNRASKKVDANRAVIAAGTGLGEGMLIYDTDSYFPVASEGGHCDLAPLNDEHDALLQWLRQRYKDHVSYERVVCGNGIFTLYEYLVSIGFAPEPEMMKNRSSSSDASAIISQCALEHNDGLCIKTLELFIEFYAAEAGNLALKSLSFGGVYIGGGIAPKILPLMKNSRFMEVFCDKGRFSPLLEEMDVKISLNQETALLGALHYAVDKLEIIL